MPRGATRGATGGVIGGVIVSAVVLAGPVRAGDPRGERDESATSTLPRGDGLAADFALDRGIEGHEAVIFAESFESGDFRERWDEARDEDRAVLSLVDLSSTSPLVGKRTLRVRADLERNTGGGLTKWFEPGEWVHVRFYVRFDEGCDYVHHFVTLRANRGLRGKDRWSGFGGAGELPAGDSRFSTALEPWGDWGRATPPGHWNFYTYWHRMEKSPDGRYWGNAFRPARPAAVPKGRWICAEFALRHSTPGKADGEQAFWIDGELRGHWRGIDWRTSEGLRANALTLESYVTDRWTKQRVNIVCFDNVVIARAYVGPAVERRSKERDD